MKIMAKKCPNCNSSKTEYRQLAWAGTIARSITEGNVILYRCLNCGNVFK